MIARFPLPARSIVLVAAWLAPAYAQEAATAPAVPNQATEEAQPPPDPPADVATAPAPAPPASMPGPSAAVRALAAARRTTAIDIDGVLDEASWQAAPVASGFWQREPREGETPQNPTEFRVLYDDEALYVGVFAYDSEPQRIRGMMTRRDQDSFSDWILICVDSYHDRRTAFAFGLNPADVQLDLLIYDDIIEDYDWNAVWDGATNVSDRGWSAEFRIPYSQLRFGSAAEQTWGMQVLRIFQRTGEMSFWNPSPKTKPQLVSLFGDVTGIRIVKPPRRLELLPYVAVGARLRASETDNPSQGPADPVYNLGFDFNYGVSSDFTLAGTFRPDFGQVEADPSEVNLSDSETFFTEKRPFFLEGIDIFRTALTQEDGGDVVDDGVSEEMFYSRRIGSVPYGSSSGAYDDGADTPTTIHGAAKLSGKTQSGWSLGMLSALTAEETVATEYADGTRGQEIIEPLANYSVLRVKKDFQAGRTNLGLTATNVVRRLDDTGLADELHRGAHAGSIQFSHRSPGGSWSLDTRMFGSLVTGTAEAITATQESSQRYYQRSDATHLAYDPTRTSLSGMAFMGSLSTLVNNRWSGAVGLDARSPGFEVNDLGFQQRADRVMNWLWAQYRNDVPGALTRDYGVKVKTWILNDWAPDLLGVGGHVNGWANLTNFWALNTSLGIEHQRLDTELLRGGPAVSGLSSYRGGFSVTSNSRKVVHGSAATNIWYRPGNDSWAVEGIVEAILQPRSNLEFRIGPFISKNNDDTQYLETVEAGDASLHYLLGRLKQTTVGLEARLNYTFMPRLSLQVYMQPFISSGRYSEYKESLDLRAAAYERRFYVFGPGEIGMAGSAAEPMLTVDRDGDGVPDFTFARPDFTVREIRSTAIVRWEYEPGSTLFAIWNHNHGSNDTNGSFRFGPNLSDLSYSRGEHVVLFKLSYWWSA